MLVRFQQGVNSDVRSQGTDGQAAAVTVVVTLLCASASYYFVEMPIRTWARNRKGQRRTGADPAGAAASRAIDELRVAGPGDLLERDR